VGLVAVAGCCADAVPVPVAGAVVVAGADPPGGVLVAGAGVVDDGRLPEAGVGNGCGVAGCADATATPSESDSTRDAVPGMSAREPGTEKRMHVL
jgi:hypothetical protein